jgi:hypothetical protein
MNNISKIVTLVLFTSLVISVAVWMYMAFVKDKPPITILEINTTYDSKKADSLLIKDKGGRIKDMP